jgi:ornithine cyclodeaminase/alanine dehydrogenase-like protein (mu-crystallin family)
VRFLDRDEVAAATPWPEIIETMAEAFRALAEGAANLPLRTIVWTPAKTGALGSMPAYLPEAESGGRRFPAVLGVKAVTFFPGNLGSALDTHQGVVVVFDAKDGRPLAICDGTEITARRTAAVSALATRLLAREDSETLALLGSGTQAGTHLQAISAVRPIRQVRVWSRNAEHARSFAQEQSHPERPVAAAASAETAVVDADIVCTLTASDEPVLSGAWLSPGTHVNAVGASTAASREIDTEAVVRASFFVDRRESALAEAGEFLLAKKQGAVDDAHIRAELGELVTGGAAGRRSREEITLFKSVGLAIEDLAAARLAIAKG